MLSPTQIFELGRPRSKPFTAVFDTTKTSAGSTMTTQLKLPISSGDFPLKVNWGDGSSNIITGITDPNLTHNYTISGLYKITINKVFTLTFNNGGDRLKLSEIKAWGDFKLTDFAFYGCANLTLSNVEGVLKPSLLVTGWVSSFRDCTSIVTINNINDWIINCNSMDSLFRGCTLLNQALSLDTSKVKSIDSIFYGCTSLNSSIYFPDTSQIESMNSVFYNCTSFNSTVFFSDTSKVKNFSGMFWNAKVFNQLLTLNTSSATSFDGMFVLTTAFNTLPLFSDTSKVISMNQMFNQSGFNQDISAWTFHKNVVFGQFMFGKTPANYSADNYSALLNKLNTALVGVGRTATKSIGMGSVKYNSLGSSARSSMVADGWSFADGGMI